MSDASGEVEKEGVVARKLLFCPWLESFEMDELIRACPNCDKFVLFCCSCAHYYPKAENVCHHFRLIFTDGACRQNGQQGATAGIGLACGTDTEGQRSIPVTDTVDPGQKRTSQRAELLAAIAGLQYMVDNKHLHVIETLEPGSRKEKKLRRKGMEPPPKDSKDQWIIATDSEYVVKGMTEWLPKWKTNKFRTNHNTKPANLDLFLQLDAALEIEEVKQDVLVGFWHISREYNTIADALAKKAAQDGDRKSVV